MNRKSKIVYWMTTVLLSLGMLSGGIGQIFRIPSTVEGMQSLGYPLYFLSIIGMWKLLGVVAILVPKLPLVKEWAYAGFFFLMTGAMISHLAAGDGIGKAAVPLLFVVLILCSWRYRPENRKLATSK